MPFPTTPLHLLSSVSPLIQVRCDVFRKLVARCLLAADDYEAARDASVGAPSSSLLSPSLLSSSLPRKVVLPGVFGPRRGTFVDLGCGSGKLVLRASVMGFDRCVGLELIPDLVDQAAALLGVWKTERPWDDGGDVCDDAGGEGEGGSGRSSDGGGGGDDGDGEYRASALERSLDRLDSGHVEFRQCDILHEDWITALRTEGSGSKGSEGGRTKGGGGSIDFVYAHTLCCPDLILGLERLRPGALLMVTTPLPASPRFAALRDAFVALDTNMNEVDPLDEGTADDFWDEPLYFAFRRREEG